MPYFVVINEQGPAWDEKRSMRDQKGWDEHALFMDGLADEHFVVLGGPLKYLKHRAMLVLNAPNEVVLRERLAEDPWMRTGEGIEYFARNICLVPDSTGRIVHLRGDRKSVV